MHVSQQFAERNVMLQIQNVTKGQHLRRVVVEHQQHTRKRQHDEQIKRDSAHAPGEAIPHRVPIDLGRVQMKEDVRKNCQRAVARIRAIV